MSNSDEHSPLLSENNDRLSTSHGPSSNSSVSSQTMGCARKFLVVICILVTELCERLTFYGVTANLLLFSSNELNLHPPWPSVVSYLFTGTCYLVPLLAGWLADTYTGRFNMIYGSSLLYVVGTLLLAAVSMGNDMIHTLFHTKATHNETMRLIYFGLALLMIAFGTGGIKANVSPFGADQVRQNGQRAVQTFFNWFYFFINVGSLVAFTVVVAVQQSDVFYGYCITAGSMFLAVIVFLVGRNQYLTKPPGGSQLTETAKIICEAVRNRKQNAGTWLEGAKRRYGGKFSEEEVEDVKALLRVIAIFGLFIVYWTIYTQMQTTFLIQATFMRLEFHNFTIPAASLSLFDIVAVLVLIPIMDHVVYPLVSYCGISFTPLRRIGVGMLLASASVIVAGVVEIQRRNTWIDGGFCIQTVFDESRNASSVNVFWQIPQFMLVGSSEVLMVITGLEFAYSQAPQSLQGLVMGAFLVTSALGSYVAIVLVIIVRAASNSDWYPSEDPNHGHMEYFYFLLSGLMVINFVVFLYIASSYKYKTVPKRTKETAKDLDTGQPADGDPSV
ncbi:solute carrier family 15 member 4-like [Orbicella faveolata]|uniref:solute carrier family 15 member 4-like n=1 Tax=Orbicella faveolata TaxID=48498 RepID=UPI0009E5A871|nr:solute carrier family 15 member 4-like [Orbicella faveolata]